MVKDYKQSLWSILMCTCLSVSLPVSLCACVSFSLFVHSDTFGLDLSKLIAFVDDKINVIHLLNFVGWGVKTNGKKYSKRQSLQGLSSKGLLKTWEKWEIRHGSRKTPNPHINPFPHNNTFWRPWEINLLKTLWKRRNCL